MWKTNNYKGETVWYSEEEYKLLQQENEEQKKLIEEASKIIDSKNGTIASLVVIREELKQKIENYKLYGSPTVVTPANHNNTEYDLLENENKNLKQVIQDVKTQLNYAVHAISGDKLMACIDKVLYILKDK